MGGLRQLVSQGTHPLPPQGGRPTKRFFSRYKKMNSDRRLAAISEEGGGGSEGSAVGSAPEDEKRYVQNVF